MYNKKSFTERLLDAMERSTFCYAKPGGQGAVLNAECPCFLAKKECCQAKKDKDAFMTAFDQLDEKYKDKSYDERAKIMLAEREEIIAGLPEELKERQWFKDNVTYSGNTPNKK